MTWKSYLYYIIATAIIAFLIARANLLALLFVPASAPFQSRLGLIFGAVLALVHILFTASLSLELYFHSFPSRDRLLIGFLFPLSVLICFAALYQQQGVFCPSQNLITNDFLMCLKVSSANFFSNPVVDCQASGDGANIAHFEPAAGWISLAIIGSFVTLLLTNRMKGANRS